MPSQGIHFGTHAFPARLLGAVVCGTVRAVRLYPYHTEYKHGFNDAVSFMLRTV